jgi:hypothetical protein
LEKKKVEVPPQVARVLKLADEEDELEVEKPTRAVAKPTTRVLAPAEESIEVIEAPLVKKRKLKKATEPSAPSVESAAPVIETAAPIVKTVNVADFLVARRKQAPPPSVSCIADVEAFLSNEPVMAVPVNVLEPAVEELIRALEGPIPSMLNQPLGSNIQHILKDLDMESEESVGMADDNTRPSTTAAVKTPQKPLSPISEAEASSRAPTPKRPRSPTHVGVDKALGPKRPRAS